MNIYVGNITHSVTEDQLRELFEQTGPVTSVKLITDKFTGEPRGFGFVQMENSQDAQKVIEELNGSEFEGRKLVVNQARERENRGGGRSGGGSRGGYNRGGGGGGGYNRGGRGY